jgi:hypothetical protein
VLRAGIAYHVCRHALRAVVWFHLTVCADKLSLESMSDEANIEVSRQKLQ